MMTTSRAVLAVLLLGSALRLAWPADMEWKGDEQWTHEHAMAIARGEGWPLVGIPSSVGLEQPGLSVWLFGLLAMLSPDPVRMAQGVQVANVLALFGFYALFRARVPPEEQEPWLWGLALMAVAPLAVLFSRKIWLQDLLPPFTLLVLLGHMNRERRGGAFGWGLAGALLGQVHMVGFAHASALAGITAICDRAQARSTRWWAWLAGGLVGLVPALPWLLHGLAGPAGLPGGRGGPGGLLRFCELWIADASGLNLGYSMGEGFWQFLREPQVLGSPTWLVAAVHLFLLAVALYAGLGWMTALPERWREGREGALLARMSWLDLYLSACLGTGLLLAVAGVRLHAHYLIAAYPFLYLWLARLVHPWRGLMAAVLVAQLFVTASFLVHVHQRGGVPEGDYGVTYRLQRR